MRTTPLRLMILHLTQMGLTDARTFMTVSRVQGAGGGRWLGKSSVSIVGGVAGGLAGKGVAEKVNPTVEDAYWRDNYSKRPYVTAGSTYDTYRPAYQYGWESYGTYRGRSWSSASRTKRRQHRAPRQSL